MRIVGPYTSYLGAPGSPVVDFIQVELPLKGQNCHFKLTTPLLKPDHLCCQLSILCTNLFELVLCLGRCLFILQELVVQLVNLEGEVLILL